MIHFRKGIVAENLRLGVHVLFGGLPQAKEVDVDALAEDVVDHLGRLLGDGGVEQPQAFLLKTGQQVGGERALDGPRCAFTSAILNVTLRPSLSSSAWHMASTQDSASRLAERMQSTRPMRKRRVDALS